MTMTRKKIRFLLNKLSVLDKDIPEFAQSTMLEFINHSETLLDEKSVVDAYLSNLLSSPLTSLVRNAQVGLGRYLVQHNNSNIYMSYFVVCLAAFFIGFIYLGFRLYKAYKQLDVEVEEQKQKIKKLHTLLKSSKDQLVKTKKNGIIRSNGHCDYSWD